MDKDKENKDRSIENKWTTLKEAVKNRTKKVFGYQKGKRAKKTMDYG